ncbi:Lar family restriction alleviation protein [Pseudomonas aeruginosa]|uniref:Lar family restriction alleviation protein n=1 Tax=Pseudomonas aeruginosa TaxID=287 RepID=UPI00053D733E|nr:Lar family restriction alleviation protein [Pseudomonas aeruginosa]UWG57405.1 Lar family restriction alleviation protein [Pseudomonas aeruginosa]
MSELKPCPFCGCSMHLESNRDWHRIVGDHALECAFTDSETMVVPATKEQRDIAVSDWNTRAVPADHVVVQRELLERLYSSDTATALMAAAELRSLLNP